MSKIKFGTDGWRAIIAKEFTVENVARVTIATSQWLNQTDAVSKTASVSVVVGHDSRFAGDLFAETVAKVSAHNGIKVYLAKGFVSTPMISFGAKQLGASLGIIITASHNPPSYNGYKLKGHYGGPLLPEEVQAIEDVIPEGNNIDLDAISLDDLEKNGLLEYVDLEDMYCEHVEKNFDLDAIKNSGLKLAYDAMYGAGQNAMKRLLPETAFFRCENNPSFYGVAPEPILKNLKGFTEFIQQRGDIDFGLATDGDADRLGIMDNEGNFIDSHHIMLLVIHYLYKYKGLKGKVATGFSSTVKIKKMCDHYGLDLDVVPIGFKFICKIMLEEDVLMGGEESGGIAIKGHIPERDGIWIGLTLLEFMAKSGKTLHELIDEVYEITGPFAFERIDLHVPEQDKQRIVKSCENGSYSTFGDYKVEKLETTDGYKFFFNDSEWVMIRPSGTEPVLRTYAESGSTANVSAILKATHETILG
ncbi:MAG: phosphoglucosamine mutase [Flavobacteriales bacterium]|nr:MAG: phosphoglucosamine mutase [Flavobacteriales bacterium]